MAVRGCLGLLSCLVLVSCGDGGNCPDPADNVVLGCPSYTCEGQAEADGDADTYESFASGFFESYCVRCHATERDLTGSCSVSNPERCRNGAPLGYDWDDPASIREHLADIREMVGTVNEMPPSDPFPSCDERRRLISWIDRGAPGLP